MNVKKQNVRWVIQSNLTSQEDLENLKNGCRNNNVECFEVKVIPFSTELSEFEIQPCNIYYGSMTFNQLIYQNAQTRKGLFYNPQTFSLENYIHKWGKHMLNFESTITSVKNLMNLNYDSEKLLFIRANDDNKSFSGEVKKFSEIQAWCEKLKTLPDSNLSLDAKIVIAEPQEISIEWRLWIVRKKVVAASKYRDNFLLSKERGCPHQVVTYAEKRCEEYTPHDVFVMDVCLFDNEYYIIECGCMNGAGFYKADVNNIVKSVTGYFGETCCL